MKKQPETLKVTIPGPAGGLEAMLEIPPEHNGSDVAVICHPHPLHGGAMTNKVAHTLARVATDLGFAALRFNFRGVGESDGRHDDGLGEVEDAQAVLDWGREKFDGRVLLAGFSFGGMVAIELARTVEPHALISIAPPVTRFAKDSAWSPPRCRWLLVHGDADDVVPCGDTLEWLNDLAPGPELKVMEGVGHFFHGNLVRLREHLVQAFEESD